jgi:hypothetical protein
VAAIGIAAARAIMTARTRVRCMAPIVPRASLASATPLSRFRHRAFGIVTNRSSTRRRGAMTARRRLRNPLAHKGLRAPCTAATRRAEAKSNCHPRVVELSPAEYLGSLPSSRGNQIGTPN